MKTRTIPFSSAQIGLRLASSIIDQRGRILLKSDTVLTPSILSKLESHAIDNIVVLAADVDSAEFDQEYLASKVTAASQYLEEMMTRLSTGEELDYSQTEQVIAPLILSDREGFHVLEMMSSLQHWHDYTYNHGVAVAALAAIVGRWLGLNSREIFDLTMAGYIHDVGKAKVPLDILDKPASLDKNEWESIKKHPEYAHDWLAHLNALSEKAVQAVYEHHERNDGTGYPRGLQDRDISIYGKILAVCDVFHACISRRSYKGPLSPFEALREIQDICPSKLDSRPVKGLLNGMVNHYRGRRVLLSDGQEGKIIFIDPDSPSRPIVATDNGPIDLSDRRDLYVRKVVS